MSIVDEVAAQLIDELGGVPISVGAVYGLDAQQLIEARHDDRMRLLASQMCSDNDLLAAGAVRSMLDLRWPEGDIAAWWWRTPTGRITARSVGRGDAEAITASVAAAMLAVSPATIRQQLYRADHGLSGSGGLERHPDGGLTRASVLARLTAR